MRHLPLAPVSVKPAAVIQAAVVGEDLPVLPGSVDPAVADRLDEVTKAIVETVERYGPDAEA